MSLIPHQFIFRGDLSAIGSLHPQIFVDALAGGQIVSYYVEAEGVSGFSGDWYFGLKKNGVDILTAAERPQITAMDLEVEVTGLSEAVSFRDRLVPTIDERGAGTITGPITIIIGIMPTEKTTPADADTVAITDSAASNATKRLSWANIKATLVTYLSTLYVALTGDQTIAGIKTFSSSPIVPTPTTATQAANKTYVDALIAGLSWKQSVRAATDAAGTLASDFTNGDTIDGVALVTGDRILIKDQAAPAENGIYIVAASGAPTRATDADAGAELVNASVYVSEGTENADKQFVCSTNAPITIGVTGITFAELTTGGGPVALADLTDVDFTVPPATGTVLVFDGLKWIADYFFGNNQAKIGLDDVTQQVIIGDVDGTGNSSTLIVDDDAELITANVPVVVPPEPYDATDWDNNNEAATKGDVRDKIEALIIGGGGYTDEMAQDAVGGILDDGGDIDFTYTDATPAIAASVKNDAVTYAKIQNVSATSRILGRKTAGAGDVEECTLSQILDFIGSAAQGDILYRDSSGWARLAAGTSGHFLKTQGAGANPTWATASGGGSGMTWTDVTGTSQSAAVNNGYIANNASLVTITLPSSAAVGDIVSVVGLGAGGWKVAQNASQEVKWITGGVDGSNETTAGTGGSLASTDRYDSIELICVVTNTTWAVRSVKGSITLV